MAARMAKRCLALAVMAAVLGSCKARQHAYPSRPLMLLCPWAAGGGTDRVSRQVAALLEDELGVPVNVVNATGGAGVTGHTRGAIARADGYTLIMLTAELNMLHWRGLTSISHHDYDPLMLINRDDAALFVRVDSPIASLPALEGAIRAAPGTLKASGTAQGGIWHVALAGWLLEAGLQPVDVTWISIGGSAPSLQELVAGGVDLVCCSLSEAKALLDAQRIRCLGLMSAQRLDAFPDVPTFRDLGVDWAMGTWRGLGLPKGEPPDRRARLAAAVHKVVTSEVYLAFMKSAGFTPAAEPSDAFAQSLARMDEQFGAILTSEAFRAVRRGQFGPMFFPGLLAALLAVNAVALALVRRAKEKTTEPFTRAGVVRMGLVLGWVVLYLLLAEWVGFVLTAGALLLALMLALRVRVRTAVVVSVVLVPAAYQLFAVALRVPLPWGWLGW
ncbi:tripartite tricarboxylate transporter substrate binding protein [bacterium]|nr:tripartite tricarboxylate transporter substrate binding protein [bacterium]